MTLDTHTRPSNDCSFGDARCQARGLSERRHCAKRNLESAAATTCRRCISSRAPTAAQLPFPRRIYASRDARAPRFSACGVSRTRPKLFFGGGKPPSQSQSVTSESATQHRDQFDTLGAMNLSCEAEDKRPRQPSIPKRSWSEGDSPSPRTPRAVAEPADEDWAEDTVRRRAA